MAQLILRGERCEVQILHPGESTYPNVGEELYSAECHVHGLIDTYDTLDDAVEYAADHADGTREE